MRFSRRLIRVPKSTIRSSLSSSLSGYESCHSSSQLHLKSNRLPCFGIAFDIDGVILRGTTPIGGSPQALNRLYDEHRRLKIPFLFLTNGGGIPESKRASELSKILGVKILPSQIVQGHSPFKKLVNRFENELVIAIGKGQPAEVMSEYGYKKVLSIDEYASYFENIDSLAPYKKWASNIENSTSKKFTPRYNVFSERVQAAFVVSDPVDWSRDIQVLCDILRTGGLPGKKFGYGCQPPLYFAADDLEYQAAFPSERLGMGAFRIALESIFNRVHPNALEYTTFGKPNPFVFKNAEDILKQIQPISQHDVYAVDNGEPPFFRSLYMIGDNPSVDIKGAKQAGRPWFSILTRTGVFKGKENHVEFPADLVVDTVEEAVDYILTKECSS